MAPSSSFRAVYKTINKQEIDVDIYLPDAETSTSSKCPICKQKFTK
jgi:hypothetical protein